MTIEARHLAFGVKQSKEVEHVSEVHREGICQEVVPLETKVQGADDKGLREEKDLSAHEIQNAQ